MAPSVAFADELKKVNKGVFFVWGDYTKPGRKLT
ncbi:hypothetical protein HY3_13930 [Hyphomonas pacifica]|uniref:Uncharacterized protein n=1 Tax=Hyphomonas pacifica TaxID=1280941 RepID=A0A8B2PP52_9PROT|nr:hypothetical protein HY3_13930 [Hyphomonas pacifica]